MMMQLHTVLSSNASSHDPGRQVVWVGFLIFLKDEAVISSYNRAEPMKLELWDSAEAGDTVSYSILDKEQGFLQLIASAQCFLWTQHSSGRQLGSFM